MSTANDRLVDSRPSSAMNLLGGLGPLPPFQHHGLLIGPFQLMACVGKALTMNIFGYSILWQASSRHAPACIELAFLEQHFLSMCTDNLGLTVLHVFAALSQTGAAVSQHVAIAG